MKTTNYVCNACGAGFNKAEKVYDEAPRQGCPRCGYEGIEVQKDTEDITKNELRQYIYLKKETELCIEKLNRLKAESIEYTELYELIENNRLRCMALLLKLQGFIYSIDDSLLRQIFEYRYINGLKWSGVAAKLGGYVTVDNVRIMHDRYLKSLENA